MVKRPSGFGKASQQKKSKTENALGDAPGAPGEEPELNIELQDETSDDELAEVYGLYTKLKGERDPRIARGLVHECDQLLRNRDSKGETLPAKFHVAYAAALLTLADPAVGEEQPKQFYKAGIERLNTGLDIVERVEVSVRALAASELVQYVHTQVRDGSISESAKKQLRRAEQLLNSSVPDIELVHAGAALLQLADDLPEEADLANAAKTLLEQQLTSDDKETVRAAHEGLGQYYLNVVAPAMDALEAEEDDDNKNSNNSEADDRANESIKKDLQAALDHLQQAITESKPQTLVMLAETLLQWSNFVDESEEEQVYADALKYLKKAQMLGVDDLHEVIESIENADEE